MPINCDLASLSQDVFHLPGSPPEIRAPAAESYSSCGPNLIGICAILLNGLTLFAVTNKFGGSAKPHYEDSNRTGMRIHDLSAALTANLSSDTLHKDPIVDHGRPPRVACGLWKSTIGPSKWKPGANQGKNSSTPRIRSVAPASIKQRAWDPSRRSL